METIKNLEGNIKNVLIDLERYERIKQKRAEIHHRYYEKVKDTYNNKIKEKIATDPEYHEKVKAKKREYYYNVLKPKAELKKSQKNLQLS